MTWVAIAALATSAVLAAFAAYQLVQAHRDIRQARLLMQQMEEDHAALVRSVLEARKTILEIRTGRLGE